MKTEAQRMIENASELSDEKCELCRRLLTKKALSYSLRFYAKKLCGSCQRVYDKVR